MALHYVPFFFLIKPLPVEARTPRLYISPCEKSYPHLCSVAVSAAQMSLERRLTAFIALGVLGAERPQPST